MCYTAGRELRGLRYYLLRAVRGVRTMGAAAAAAAAAAVLGLAAKGVADAPRRLHGTVGNLNPVPTLNSSATPPSAGGCNQAGHYSLPNPECLHDAIILLNG